MLATVPAVSFTNLASRSSAPARVAVVRLSLGAPAGPVADWNTVLDHAIRERCASLAWLRSAAYIRREAPGSVTDRWRGEALAAGELAAAQLSEVAALSCVLEEAALEPTLLKGHGLSEFLYGDALVRPIFDVDVFIAVHEREAAHARLLQCGWKHLDGFAPAEGTYRRTPPARLDHVEIHSALLDDGLLAHLDVKAPERTRRNVGGYDLPVQREESLPLFLAAHLAKHQDVPLLWWIDFATLWNRLNESQRLDAALQAKRSGLSRVLTWAERGVRWIDAIAREDLPDAIRALAALDALTRGRNASRLVRLLDGQNARAKVAIAWLVPPPARRSWGAFMTVSLRRIASKFGSQSRDVRANDVRRGHAEAVDPVMRPLELDGQAIASLFREAGSAAALLPVRVRGTSMLPTIPRVADVIVGGVPTDGVERGDVVLAYRDDVGLIMHRVVDSDGDEITLKGDNRFEPDPPLHRNDIIGVARELCTEGGPRPISRRPVRSFRFTLARVRTFLHRQIANG